MSAADKMAEALRETLDWVNRFCRIKDAESESRALDALAAYEAEKAQPAPESAELSTEQIHALGRQVFESYHGRPHPWEGVQPWVLALVRKAIAAGRADAHPAPEPDDAQVKAAAIAAGLYPDDHELSASELMHLSAFARQFAVGRADAQPADKLDAERYRWLQERERWVSIRVDFDRDSIYHRHRVVWHADSGWHTAEGQSLDEAIDAAMLAARAEKGGT